MKCHICEKESFLNSACKGCGKVTCSNSKCYSKKPNNLLFCHPAYLDLKWAYGIMGDWTCQKCFDKIVAPLQKLFENREENKLQVYSKNFQGRIVGKTANHIILKTAFMKNKDDALMWLKLSAIAMNATRVVEWTTERKTDTDGSYTWSIWSASGKIYY